MTDLPISPPLLVMLALFGVLFAGLLLAGRVPLRYNIRNLAVRWRMSLLTGAAFALVIFVLTVMLAFVNGMGKLTEESGHPQNVVVLADGANDESFSNLPLNETSDVAFQPGVRRWKRHADDPEGTPLCSRELYVIGTMPVAPEQGQTSGKQARATVQRVLIDKQAIITGLANKETTVHLDAGGKVFINGLEARLENLKPGDHLWFAYVERDGQTWATEIHSSNKQRFVQIRGIEDPLIAAEVHGLRLVEGKWFGSGGVVDLPAGDGKPAETAVQAVLGIGLARELGHDFQKPRLQIGDVFTLGPRQWSVVGILDSEGTTFDSEIWAKRSYVGQLYDKPDTISSMVLRTDSAAAAEKLAKFLKTEYKKTNLQPLTEPEYYAKLRGVSKQLYVAIVFLTFFMSIGGIFGVMNTMFAAISQRIKDIGVLRIIGFARWQVLVSFLLESLLIALVGGALGCAAGSLCDGISATSIVGSGQGGFGKTVIFRLSVDMNTIGIGMLLTLFMGLLGGLLPSLAAMRLRALDAVR